MDINKIAFNKMGSKDIEAVLNNLASQPGGMQKIAALVREPVLEDVLYESRGRQLLQTVTLNPGEEATVDGDIRVPGVALSREGLPYIVEVNSNRVRIDTSANTVSALLRWNELNYRKFDVLDWAQARAKSALLEQEDSRVVSVVDFASTQYHAKVNSPGYLYVDAIAEAAAMVSDSLRTSAVTLLIPTIRQKDLFILKYRNGDNVDRQMWTPEANDEILRKGILGSIGNLKVIDIPKRQDGTSIIDPNSVYVLGPKELVGAFVVRTDIVARTQTDIKNNGEILNFWEDFGVYCRYSKGIVKIDLTPA
jgi:hypothetical protein